MACITDTPTVALAVAAGALSAAVKVSADAGNELAVHADGLFVGGPDVLIPSGAMVDFSAAAAPSGWLLCDGAAVSRSTFATLFGIIGTTYGSGDGSTTFNTPDYRGRVSVGYAASGGHVDASTLAANEGQPAANRRSRHRTTNALGVSNSLGLNDPGHAHTNTVNTTVGGGVAGVIGEVNHNADTLRSTGVATTGISLTGGVALNGSIGTNNGNDALDTPCYIVSNKIIKT